MSKVLNPKTTPTLCDLGGPRCERLVLHMKKSIPLFDFLSDNVTSLAISLESAQLSQLWVGE